MCAMAQERSELVRIGIVVSNAAYDAGLSKLKSAHEDADRIERSLRALEFKAVRRGRYLRRGGIEQLLRDVESQIAGRRAGTIFLYYEG